jgi:hypothetical protein
MHFAPYVLHLPLYAFCMIEKIGAEKKMPRNTTATPSIAITIQKIVTKEGIISVYWMRPEHTAFNLPGLSTTSPIANKVPPKPIARFAFLLSYKALS